MLSIITFYWVLSCCISNYFWLIFVHTKSIYSCTNTGQTQLPQINKDHYIPTKYLHLPITYLQNMTTQIHYITLGGHELHHGC